MTNQGRHPGESRDPGFKLQEQDWTPAFAGVTARRIFIFFVPLLLALPFLHRAYFVDDHYFVEIASWLKDHPDRPYDFRADDAGPQNKGWEDNGFVRMVNPLAHQYYLALLLKVQGLAPRSSPEANEAGFLRLGCVLLSCFSALFLFEFARRWTNAPVLSTLLILCTPAIWLSSYSLLIDSTMVFFAFGALYFFIRATETPHPSPLPEGRGNTVFLILSGVFAGMAILSKYPGIFILPLMGTYLALRWKKLNGHWRFFIPMLMGLIFLWAYSAWTAHLYGAPHILAASARMVHVFGWPKLFSFFVFLSGSLLIPLLAWIITPARQRVIATLFVFITTVFLSSKLGGYTVGQSFLLGLWLVTSFLFLGAFWSLRSDWIFPRDYFLFFWLIGFVVMMLVVMDWVAVRYFCLAAPAVVLLTVRMIEIKYPERAFAILRTTLMAVFISTAALAYSDYQQAKPSLLVREELKQKGYTGGERHFYLGDSFTMSYLKLDGWVPCFPETTLQVGDLVLSKEVTMPLIWFAQKPVAIREIAQFNYPTYFPIKVMSMQGSAGFYASVWGALPFTFWNGPWERFHLYEVTALVPDDVA